MNTSAYKHLALVRGIREQDAEKMYGYKRGSKSGMDKIKQL
jgi:hypothetical protein